MTSRAGATGTTTRVTTDGLPRRRWALALVVTWGALLTLQAALDLTTPAVVVLGTCVGVLLVVLDARLRRRGRGPD